MANNQKVYYFYTHPVVVTLFFLLVALVIFFMDSFNSNDYLINCLMFMVTLILNLTVGRLLFKTTGKLVLDGSELKIYNGFKVYRLEISSTRFYFGKNYYIGRGVYQYPIYITGNTISKNNVINPISLKLLGQLKDVERFKQFYMTYLLDKVGQLPDDEDWSIDYLNRLKIHTNHK